MNRNLLKKNKQVVNSEKITPKKYAGSTWVSTVFQKVCNTKKPLPVTDLQHIAISEKCVSDTLISYDDNQHDTSNKPEQVSVTLNVAEKTVPARPFFRYSMNNTDRRSFQCRRIIQPFKPVYEVEWQKDQWLQLDKSTNKQIEGLRKNGFSRVPIRKDIILMKHIMYDDPSELDILLELDLCNNNNDSKKNITDEQPFLPFSVRRTHWWHTSYQIGQANLPEWVDADICCTPSVPSVFTVVSNNSSRSIKPLQYNEPPFMLAQSV
ncbi:hypothetical protein HPULCUR_011766 [Helicostylum pulchrum]|uniref:Uncharacterized protein n=1 Tax=Helicostylum pulchrum TaxID=562976 RepID=A0ABP9YH15_9FUNG